jgi:hypothetical protein
MQNVQSTTTHLTKFSGDWAITFTGHGKSVSDRQEYMPCSFTVVNKGQLVNDVTIELYRPFVNKQTHTLAMIAGTATSDLMKHGEELTLRNLPIQHNVGKVEFLISWKLDGRKYMQTVTFTQGELQ